MSNGIVKEAYMADPHDKPNIHLTESEMSDEDVRRLLQGALKQYLTAQNPETGDDFWSNRGWIRDVYDTYFVYEQGDQNYSMPYTMEGTNITLGNPTKVLATTVYQTIESLSGVYTDIIKEAGRRNSSLDETKIKQILSLCQELLNKAEETVEESAATKVLHEAEAVLSWLLEQETMKTEDGEKYPAEAYAYVPDPEKSSGWKLRLWQTPSLKVTRSQLGRAAAALSPGGYRGQKVVIPAEDLPAVKRKIRAEYSKLDVSLEDMPKWVKEARTSRIGLAMVVPLTEASVDGKGIAHVKIVQPGFNYGNGRYYLPEALSRDFAVFEGVKMYADHPTDAEEEARPERSIRDWVATLKNVTVMEDNSLEGDAHIVEPWMKEKLSTLREHGMLGDMGISINAIGTAYEDTIDGIKTQAVDSLVMARSVDFVTEPGAGGEVQMYESMNPQLDIDLINMDTLKERRPDLVKSLEIAAKNTTLKEAKMTKELEETITTLKESNKTLTEENAELNAKLTEADKKEAKATAQATIKEAVDKAELPDAAKTRLIKKFSEAETAEGIDAAIQDEVDYLAELSESGKVKGLGNTSEDVDPKKMENDLRESFKRLNPAWNDAQIEIAMKGR